MTTRRTHIVCCRSGRRSAIALELIARRGFATATATATATGRAIVTAP